MNNSFIQTKIADYLLKTVLHILKSNLPSIRDVIYFYKYFLSTSDVIKTIITNLKECL